jgi:hypothetical protein
LGKNKSWIIVVVFVLDCSSTQKQSFAKSWRNYIRKLARIHVAIFFCNNWKNEVLARGSILESSLEFMLQVLLEPRKQSTYCIGMLVRIHVIIFFRTATKNKKLLAGGIQSENSRSNCDVANLVTTAKKT